MFSRRLKEKIEALEIDKEIQEDTIRQQKALIEDLISVNKEQKEIILSLEEEKPTYFGGK
jgi:hypothetical protein